MSRYGNRTIKDQDAKRINIRPSDLERQITELTAEIDGAPHDGRAKGPALGPWLLTLIVDRARTLTGAPEGCTDEELLDALKEAINGH